MSDSFSHRVHVLVEAVRNFEQADGRAPNAEEVAEELGCSMEEVYFLLHRLVEHGVLSPIPSAYEDRYAVQDEDLLESLPLPEDEPSFEEAHQERKTIIAEQVDRIERRFSLDYKDEEKDKSFAQIQARFSGKEDGRPNPLDKKPKPLIPAGKPRQENLFEKLSKELSGKKEGKPNPLDALTRKS